MRLKRFPAVFLMGAVLAVRAAHGQTPEAHQANFPFLTACIEAKTPPGNIANKGVAILLGNDAAICFDTDLLRVSAGWIGPRDWTNALGKIKRDVLNTHPGWAGRILDLNGVTFDDRHGGHPMIIGEVKFSTRPLPGWADAQGEFKDARPEPFGPIAREHGRWQGLYVHGQNVVLAYTVHSTQIHEQPSSVAHDGETGFVRTFKTERIKEALTLMVCEDAGATGALEDGQAILRHASGGLTKVGLVGAPQGARLEVAQQNQVLLRLPKNAPASTFKLVIWQGEPSRASAFAGLLQGQPSLINFAQGGPANWPATVETKGALATSQTPDGAYVVDQLTPPADNPWKRRVRFGGMDFFADGKRAALSTWDGDVWIVSGIDDKLEKLTWKRFASGGFETLGLKIVDDVIYTSGRDQITRYHDFNGDGEADFYESFNNQITSSPGFHEFVFDLHTDPQGNFYTIKAGPVRSGGSGFGGGGGNGQISAHAGTLMKISKDGSQFEVYATGFRAPNGMGVGPNGEVTSGDNEGTWMPTCPINWIKPGGFYGVEDTAHKTPVPPFDAPLCWLSKRFDNSGGSQVWVTSDRWGPFGGEMLHLSYGRCRLYLVMKQEVNGRMQGGVVQIPVKFRSSAMRARFNPRDGQLYVAGLRGWQTEAANLTGFDRVRYTGQPVASVKDLQVIKGAVRLTFTQPLDPSAADADNFSVERWNYLRTKNYGSPEVSVDDPGQRKHDRVEVTGASLSADGKTLTLQIPDLKPAMQQTIKYDKLKTRDGAEISQTIMHTIHAIPDGRLAAAF